MDDVPAGDGWGREGLRDDAGAAVGDALGGAAVEAEDLRVEIGFSMLGADGAMVGAHAPAFGEAEDQVDGRQALRSVAPNAAELARLMGKAGVAKPAVAGPAVDRRPEQSNLAATECCARDQGKKPLLRDRSGLYG
jgi:hypothetical protein